MGVFMKANFYEKGYMWKVMDGSRTILNYGINFVSLNVVLDFVEGVDTEDEFENLTWEQQKEILDDFKENVFSSEDFGSYLLDNLSEIKRSVEEGEKGVFEV